MLELTNARLEQVVKGLRAFKAVLDGRPGKPGWDALAARRDAAATEVADLEQRHGTAITAFHERDQAIKNCREAAFVEFGGPTDERGQRLSRMRSLAYNDLSADNQTVAAVQAMEAILAKHATGTPDCVVHAGDKHGGLVLYGRNFAARGDAPADYWLAEHLIQHMQLSHEVMPYLRWSYFRSGQDDLMAVRHVREELLGRTLGRGREVERPTDEERLHVRRSDTVELALAGCSRPGIGQQPSAPRERGPDVAQVHVTLLLPD